MPKQRTKAPRGPKRSLVQEVLNVNRVLAESGFITLPAKLAQTFVTNSSLDKPKYGEKLMELVGDTVVEAFDSLGPVYGKAAQMSLSRLSPGLQGLADRLRLTRLYGDWPAMPFAEVEAILDQEIPHWHGRLKINAYPLGVASMAQVHEAIDEQGRAWVVKVLKPHAAKRLMETVAALEQLVSILEPVVFSKVGKRAIREIRELCGAFRREVDLDQERVNIAKVRQRLAGRKQKVLSIPDTNEEFCTSKVLTIQKFEGVNLAHVVSGRATLTAEARKGLARKVLQELLVQVFEIGLFHADPHAGNLILLEDGTVGLFDWGLTGELKDSDRRHIAAMLKAVLALDLDRLGDALLMIAEEEGSQIEKKAVLKELGRMAARLKKQREAGGKVSLQAHLEDALAAADRLGIPVPDGLLMMAKSLLTIEGLARGIDPDIRLTRVATPLLWKVARPGLKDFVYFSKRMPLVMSRLLGNKEASAP